MANSTFLLHFTTNDLLECIFQSSNRSTDEFSSTSTLLYTTPLDLSPRVPAPVAQRFVFIRRCKSKERRWLRSHNREFTVETEFPPKVQAKRASNSETSCWFLRVGKRVGDGRLPKERIERIFAAPRINSTVYIYSKPMDIIRLNIGDTCLVHDWWQIQNDSRFVCIESLLRIYFSRGNFMFDWNCIL